MSSEPPAVKVAKVEAASRLALLIAVLGEASVLAGIVAITVLMLARCVSGDWAYAIVALATGAAVGKIRGGGVVGLVALIPKTVYATLEAMRHHV